jgi:KDO2-lipid IV(A) lauroyltransferase
MNKDFIIDYSGFILFKVLGPLARLLPKTLSLFLGRLLGDLFYIFDLKHRAIAYANIKTALGEKLTPSQIRKVNRRFFQSFGQNIIEIFFIPLIDNNYIKKFVSIQGREYIDRGFKRGKGVIFLAVHAGSWELSNIISANLGFPFSMFVREQKFPRLEKLLNSYRRSKGCRIIERQDQTHQLIQVLKSNEAIAITLDQGGRNGMPVKFFNKYASMASGAIRLALKYDASLIPIFPTRIKGAYLEFHVEPPFELKKTADSEKDLRDNLGELVHIFQRYIEKYPQEYLWSYKIWKYATQKNILILSDGKAGHLRQSEALALILTEHFKDRGISTNINTAEVKFKNSLSRSFLTLSNCLAGKYICQGCLFCLRRLLRKDVYDYLIKLKPDIIISCGSSLAAINYILSKENQAKSFVIMRPSIFSTSRFDLLVIAKHDNPPLKRNIAAVDGALNLIDEEYLKDQSKELSVFLGNKAQPSQIYIGILIGGNTKDFHLKPKDILAVSQQIKSTAEELNALILITTSRRTPPAVEDLVKKEFKDYRRCKLLVIANEKNYPFTVGGILGLSQMVVISPESISMISEAVSSRKYVLVFGYQGIKGRHRKFLDNLAGNNYIYLTQAEDLSKTLVFLWSVRPEIKILKDNLVVKEAIKKVL